MVITNFKRSENDILFMAKSVSYVAVKNEIVLQLSHNIGFPLIEMQRLSSFCVYKQYKHSSIMGLLGIGKGLLKTIEGVLEGDMEKVGKGVVKIVKGVATTVLLGGSDDDDDD